MSESGRDFSQRCSRILASIGRILSLVGFFVAAWMVAYLLPVPSFLVLVLALLLVFLRFVVGAFILGELGDRFAAILLALLSLTLLGAFIVFGGFPPWERGYESAGYGIYLSGIAYAAYNLIRWAIMIGRKPLDL